MILSNNNIMLFMKSDILRKSIILECYPNASSDKMVMS